MREDQLEYLEKHFAEGFILLRVVDGKVVLCAKLTGPDSDLPDYLAHLLQLMDPEKLNELFGESGAEEES